MCVLAQPLPRPPCLQSVLSSPSRSRPQAGLSTPRADLAPLRLTTRPWLPSTAGQRQAPQPGRPGPADMSPASSPASLSLCLPADLTFQQADPPSAGRSLTLPSVGRLHLLFTHISEPLFSVRIQLLPRAQFKPVTCASIHPDPPHSYALRSFPNIAQMSTNNGLSQPFVPLSRTHNELAHPNSHLRTQ